MRRKKKEMKYSGIGGQAVLEGIMMKNKDQYAVAVRKPNGEIEVEVEHYVGIAHGSRVLKIPFIRGIFQFIDSLALGMKCLNFSATFYEEDEGGETAADKAFNKVFKDKADKVFGALVMIVSVAIALGVFMVLPYYITSLFEEYIRSESLMAIIEGALRIIIFVVYVASISLMKDIRRVYRYHGAEHKCINCVEKGRPLTVKNVMKCSRQHRRCGTSFLLFVMLVSVVLFFFIRVDHLVYRVLLRIALIPVIAGISYEIIRLAGRSNNILVRILSAPGMLLQRLTTREPDRDSFTIYQLKDGDETRDFRFEPYDRLQAAGLAVDPANYEAVYTAPLSPDMSLEDIYTRFNIDHPKDFTGHSLSVSDVVVLHQSGQDAAHYVDSFGFRQVPEFLQEQEPQLTPDARMTGEQIRTPRGSFHVTDMTAEEMKAAGYGLHHTSEDGKYLIMGNGTQAYAVAAEQPQQEKPTHTAGELEAKARAGEQISLAEYAAALKAERPRGRDKEEKPSIRAQLKAGKEKAAQKKPARSKSQDLERS